MSLRPHAVRAAWALLAVPGLLQLGLLLYAVAGRFLYPYDLEWMEGGLLAHAARLAAGENIYPPPSVDFIPYLYTPLYPALVALLGQVAGIGYQVARAISILSILGVVVLMGLAIHGGAARPAGDHDHAAAPEDAAGRWPAWCGCALAAGFFAATYPWVEGWYDLVRADTLFLFMMLSGLLLLARAARVPRHMPHGPQGPHDAGSRWRSRGQLAVAGAAAVLALSFFCKQTGVLYVAAGGALLLIWCWRRVPVYVVTAGIIGLGGTAVLTRMTGGWFWTYIFEVHQAHHFSTNRFYESFGHIAWKFPAMTVTVAVAVVAALVTWAAHGQRPRGAGSLFTWTFVFAVSCLVGALGWGTQWAHFNAYMPAMMTGALAAGAAIPAVHGCAHAWHRARAARDASRPGNHPDSRPATHGALASLPAAALALACGVQLYQARWQPGEYIPTARDRAAGDALIDHIRTLRASGDVYVPFHPWYVRLAGQRHIYTHRMGLMDLGFGNRWTVAGVREAFRDHRFTAVIFDNRAPGWELPGLQQYYRQERSIPAHMAPRLYTGARVVPHSVWVPRARGSGKHSP